MGLDMRVIPDDRIDCIVSDLRSHGFDVGIHLRSVTLTQADCRLIGVVYPHEPFITRQIECRRGCYRIVLRVVSGEEPFSGYRIYIPNLRSWWPSRNRELAKLQSDVTAILEANGAYWPYNQDGG